MKPQQPIESQGTRLLRQLFLDNKRIFTINN